MLLQINHNYSFNNYVFSTLDLFVESKVTGVVFIILNSKVNTVRNKGLLMLSTK